MSTSPGRGGSPSITQPKYWWYSVRSDLLQAAFAGSIEPGCRILDVGSADGPSVEWLHDHGSVISLDMDSRGLNPPNAVCGSVLQLPFKDNTFGLVSAFDVIEHCAPEADAVSEVARVLRPGGQALISVPAYQWAWSEHDVANGHHRRYTISGATAMVERAGLRVHRATHAFTGVFPFFAAERLVRRLSGRFVTSATAPADDVDVPHLSKPLERLMTSLSRLDRYVLGVGRDLPFGSSVLLAATKPPTSSECG